jgi:hypothetical protein
MKKFILILLVLLILVISSCRSVEETVAEGFAAGLSEAIGEVIKEMMTHSMSIYAYYVEYKKWPSDQNDLCTFCEVEGFEHSLQFWSSCNNMEFSVQEDESIEISFTKTIKDSEGKLAESPGSMKLPKPDCDEQEIDQIMSELLEIRENINKPSQSPPDENGG